MDTQSTERTMKEILTQIVVFFFGVSYFHVAGVEQRNILQSRGTEAFRTVAGLGLVYWKEPDG